jgi:hypothetical protein
MAPQYGAGSCRCLSRWRGSIELRFRHTDLCDSTGLSGFDLIDGRLSDCNREVERQRRQGTLLPANWVEGVKVTPGQRVSAISNDAGTFSLFITELTD